MARLRKQLDQGIFGQRFLGAAVAIGLGAATYLASLPYDLLNHGPNVLFLKTPIDELIPVVPALVVPYVSLRPFIYVSGVLLLLFRVRIYRSAQLSLALAFLVSYVFYLYLQTYVDRPQLTGDDLFTRMIREVYASDQPYNDFPSLHVALSTVLAIHWWRVSPRLGRPIAAWVALIVVSTVFVKQHYVPDIAGGLLVAVAVSWVAVRVDGVWETSRLRRKLVDRQP